MSENATKEQRRKQKKKEAKKRKQLEKSKLNEAEKVEDDASNRDNDVKNTPVAEKAKCLTDKGAGAEDNGNFEDELCWCIEQLQLGLKNKRPSKEQAEKATKLIALLRSEKATKVRKRHAMRTTFGDYRKKMATEAKQRTPQAIKEPKISSVREERMKESMFLKPKSEALAEPAENRDTQDGEWHFKKSDNDFQFLFPDPE